MTFFRGSLPRVAAAAVGAGMLLFAAVLALRGCGACARAASPLLAAAGGLLWCGAAALRRPAPAAGAGIFLLASHLGLVLSAPAGPCPACLVLLGAESIAAGFLVSKAGLRRLPVAAACAVLAAAGGAAGVGASRLAWPVGPDRILARSMDPAAPGSLWVYVVVPGDCPGCPEGVGIAMAVEERGIARAVIVDGRSDQGRRLRRENGLKALPAFVAGRGERVVAVQSGGAVEGFLDRLPR